MQHRIFFSIAILLVVAWMTWDQVTLKRMTPWKWPLAALILTVLEASVWMN